MRTYINYKDYKVDWDEQQGRMLITKDNNLSIMDIKRNFPSVHHHHYGGNAKKNFC